MHVYFCSDCLRCLANQCQYLVCTYITYVEWYGMHGGLIHLFLSIYYGRSSVSKEGDASRDIVHCLLGSV